MAPLGGLNVVITQLEEMLKPFQKLKPYLEQETRKNPKNPLFSKNKCSHHRNGSHGNFFFHLSVCTALQTGKVSALFNNIFIAS